MAVALVLPLAIVAGRTADKGADFYLNLPSDLKEAQTGQTTYVYAADGSTLLTMFYEEYRHYAPMAEISPFVAQAVVAAEDARFYEHNGVDLRGVARAFVANQKSGDVAQGASTLTMQYVRMARRDAATSPEEVIQATEQTHQRKLQEMKMSIELEKRLSKAEILERYLNIAYFGHRAYGIHAGSEIYFSKPPKDLTLAEAATLAGLVKAPSSFDPATHETTDAKDRRDYVLGQMAVNHYITDAQAEAAKAEPLQLNVYEPPNDCVSVPSAANSWGFFCDFFKSWWTSQPAFGENPEARLDTLRRGGYKIVTTLDPSIQAKAEASVLAKEGVDSVFAHGAVAVEPGTGRVKAMAVNRVYSVDQTANGPNTDPAKAGVVPGNYPNTVNPLLGGGDLPGYQAGSTFKFFTMLAALEAGLPLSTAIDAPRKYTSIYLANPGEPSSCGDRWCPSNASDAMTGRQTMWSGFGKSVNTYWVQLEQMVGANNVVHMAERLGLKWRSETDAQLASTPASAATWGSFTLGTADTTPLEMANAYATAAADGVYCEPTPILSITGLDGAALAEPANTKCHQEITPAVARAATDAARCVTGYGASGGACGDWSTAPGVYGAVGRPVAGKTGTTDDTRSAWFVGYTPQLAVASFIADPDNPFDLAGDGNAWKPVTSVADILREGLAEQPVAYFAYP